MNWNLIVIVERSDGTILRQRVRKISEEESIDNSLIHKALQEYKKLLGEDYFIIDYYVGY